MACKKKKYAEGTQGAKTADPYAGMYSGAGQILGSVTEAIEDPRDGKSSVTGNALSMAGQGAAMGAAFGGVGSIVGGAAGLIGGGITAAVKNKRIDENLKAQEVKDEAMQTSKNYVPMVNTQTPIYAKGTPAAGMGVSEVERDELIMRKDSKGKFQLLADMQGGKSHTRGGEDVVLAEDDIVFPGKDRSKIMKLYKAGDHLNLEAERLRLPKDSGQTEFEYGTSGKKPTAFETSQYEKYGADNSVLGKAYRRNYESKYIPKAPSSKESPWYGTSNDDTKTYFGGMPAPDANTPAGIAVMAEGTSKEKPSRLQLPTDPDENGEYQDGTQYYTGAEFTYAGSPSAPYNTPAGIVERILTPEQRKADADAVNGVPNVPYRKEDRLRPQDAPEVVLGDMPASAMPRETIDFMSDVTALNNTIPREGSTFPEPTDYLVPGITDEQEVDDTVLPTAQKEAAQKEAPKEGMDLSVLNNLADYAPGISAMIKGSMAPETVERKYQNPKLQQYSDMSAQVRSEIGRRERLDRLAADRSGSPQQARARKELASAQALDRLGKVSSQEAQRADAVNRQNLATLNQSEAANIAKFDQYENIDSANRAASDAYVDQGLASISQNVKVNQMDKRKAEIQDTLLKNIDSKNYRTNEDGSINFERTLAAESDFGGVRQAEAMSKMVTEDIVAETAVTEDATAEVVTSPGADRIFASGKYQVIPDTMQKAIDAGVVTGDDMYGEDVQERIGEWLITKKAGGGVAGSYISGKIDDVNKAADALASEWAGLPLSNGKSKYGDGNHASAKRADVVAALQIAKKTGNLDPIKKLISKAESGGDYDIYNQGTKDGSIVPASKSGHKVSGMTISDILNLS